MHPLIHQLATTMVALIMQIMIKFQNLLNKENWDVNNWDIDDKHFWFDVFSPLLWLSYACVLILAAMLLAWLAVFKRSSEKKKVADFRFSHRSSVNYQRRRLPSYLYSFEYED